MCGWNWAHKGSGYSVSYHFSSVGGENGGSISWVLTILQWPLLTPVKGETTTRKGWTVFRLSFLMQSHMQCFHCFLAFAPVIKSTCLLFLQEINTKISVSGILTHASANSIIYIQIKQSMSGNSLNTCSTLSITKRKYVIQPFTTQFNEALNAKLL